MHYAAKSISLSAMTITQIDAGGGTLAVETHGEGPLVVCSPAMGDTRDAYAPLAQQLVAAGYRVALVDLRGHGDSSADFDAYGDEATAEDLLTVIDALGADRAVLAGASMSAAAAVIAAGSRPDAVSALVLLAPFLRNGGGAWAQRLLHVALLRPWGPTVWKLYAGRLWPGLGDAARERAATTTALLRRPGRWRAFHATTRTDHAVVEPWLPSVVAPALVVMGDADPDWGDPVAEAAWVASSLPVASTHVVPGAGHAPMLERPEDVGAAVLGFLAPLRAAGTLGVPRG